MNDRGLKRRYSEGRCVLEERLETVFMERAGATSWEYYVEGGVKKILISEKGPQLELIREWVENDDGSFGWPEPLPPLPHGHQ